MRTRVNALLACGAFLVLLSYAGAVNALTEIRVGGTGMASLLLERLATSYQSVSSNVVVRTVHPPLGSAGSLRALSAGLLDVAVISSPMHPHQRAQPYTGLNSASPWIVTPMVFSGRDLPESFKLTSNQIIDIYAGKVSHWSDGGLIRLITRPIQESDTKILKGVSPEMDQAVSKAMSRIGISVAENDIFNQKMLEKTPGSFGMIALGQIRLTGSSLKPAILNGIEPNSANLQIGRYPISKSLYIVLSNSAGPDAKAFVKFLQNPTTLRRLEKQGFVAINH